MNKTFKVAQVRGLLNQVNNEQITFSRFVEILNEAQKEAYNQALEDAAKKAKVSLFNWINGDFKEFKQNSNHYSIDYGAYVKIDEQSILKLKK